MNKVILVVCFLSLILCSQIAFADWDKSYDGNLLPNDSSYGSSYWAPESPLCLDGTSCTASNGILHINDTSASMYANYGQNASTTGSFTMEARVKVLSEASSLIPLYSGAVLGGTDSARSAMLFINPTGISTLINNGQSLWTYNIDMTDFHTIRLALQNDQDTWIWVDGNTIYHQAADTSQGNGILFGSGLIGSTQSDSYWDYVNLSNSFVPVPEPSSLAILATGLLPLGLVARRRINK